MLSALTDEDVVLSKTLGVYTLPGVAEAYPELASMVRIMYQNRFAHLPFVPANWFDGVNKLLGVNGNMILPVPAFDTLGRDSAGMPDWLDTHDKRVAWEEARNALKSGYMKFTQGQIDEGRTLLNALYAKADFWNALYSAARYIADVPKNALFATIKAAIKVLWPYAIIGGVIYFGLPYAKRHFAKSFSKSGEG